ncbi:tripartite tricarboxylate transporter TctB family protein [Tropicimonas marinistellae]|uniref:tripartite tricarboxylate transporter TctB family protein n=1 Tax=Tropicimonas marinistellae TaxID=1739787 RepID=UPI00082F621E|nr:tripartite tricarboxylate transporter TctB family protein [Tropicimonas marinistellae]
MRRLKALAMRLESDRKPGDFVFALSIMLLSLTLLALLPLQTSWVEGTRFAAQPAFWPGVGVLMMVGFGAIHLGGSLVSPREPGAREEVLRWLRSLEFVGWFLAYVALVPRLGYLPMTLAFAILLVWRLGYRSAKSYLAAATFGFAVVAVFKAGLQVKVPAGAAYEYLPDQIRTFMMVNF